MAISERLYIAYVISTYWVVSISMVYLNKLLLSSSDASIAAPLFVTWFQCVVTCIIVYLLGEYSDSRKILGEKSWLDDFPRVSYNVS
jgi:hypothetical protein